MIFRPATPGFLVTLAATVLLALVSFSTPLIKSIYFLKGVVDLNGQKGTATFGVLGYCLDTGGSVNCTSPHVGYEFDPNALLDNTTRIKIPQVIVKWLTYALVIHIVALVFAAGSALFGLLAHVRELSMTCCSTCVSGFGAVVALIAFVFDIAFFFVVKARLDKVPGGSAQIGIGVWLTLAAWILLFFAGCFYGLGRCCISNRPRGRDKRLDSPHTTGHEGGYIEAMRLDAVKVEADRKAQQKHGEVGLPAFNEYDPSKPLNSKYDEEDETYSDRQARQPGVYPSTHPGGGLYSAGYPGYAPAAPGTSAMEAYYAVPGEVYPSRNPSNVAGYPPQSSMHALNPSTQYNAYANPNRQPSQDQYLSPGTYAHGQYPSNETVYGHRPQETSYYSAASHYQQPSHNPDPSSYNQHGYAPPDTPAPYPASSAASTTLGSHNDHEASQSKFVGSAAPRSMGRDDYSFRSTPSPMPLSTSSYTPSPMPMGSSSYTPSAHDSAGSSHRSPIPRGPRSPTTPTTVYSQQTHSDSPPGYEVGNAPTTVWANEKH